MTKRTIENIKKVVEYGKEFFADEIGFNGGEINALSRHELIEETGKTKKYYVEIDDDYAKKVTVSQWRLSKKGIDSALENIFKDISSLMATAEALQKVAC